MIWQGWFDKRMQNLQHKYINSYKLPGYVWMGSEEKNLSWRKSQYNALLNCVQVHKLIHLFIYIYFRAGHFRKHFYTHFSFLPVVDHDKYAVE